MFDGRLVGSVLSFTLPYAALSGISRGGIRQLSISGVQLKYSLRLEGNVLVIAEEQGQYILKPIPLSHIAFPDQVPENEHLTMQIAAQLFNMVTAANALIYFSDGTPAYLTRRFDLDHNGPKHLQEDFAQISMKTKESHGAHYKYTGSYEELGLLINKHVAAAMPIAERFFEVIFFNYLFSNGDAHLKNFSLARSEAGNYELTPAYDLLSTVLHTPMESDTALDLFAGDIDTPYYQTYGHYGYRHFIELATRIGILEPRAKRLISKLISKDKEVAQMIALSFLSADAKDKYLAAYTDKVKRIKME